MQRSETMPIHIALVRMHQQLFPERYNDDAPLGESSGQVAQGHEGTGVTTIADLLQAAKAERASG